MKSKYNILTGLCVLLPFQVFSQKSFNERETSSVQIVTEDDLDKNNSENPYETLYGLIPGLSVIQNVGWNNNPTLFLRGRQNPLILVDGIPRKLEYVSTVEIDNIKVLKDGAATAMYGTRGANGVILITTKRGDYNSKEISLNYNHGMGFLNEQPEMADGYSYALARNEALHYDGLPLQYSQSQLDAFKNGTYPDLFSNTDWINESLRSSTHKNQFDIVFKGGINKVRYFTSFSYKNEMGILSPEYTDRERYNSQMRKYSLNVRMNIDVDVTSTTLLKWNMFGSLQERTRPREYESTIFPLLYNTPAAVFPVRTENGYWGGGLVHTNNPIATYSDKGYFKENPRVLQADLRLIQNLSSITEGLSAELSFSYDNYASYKEEGITSYRYEVNTPMLNAATGEYDKKSTVYGGTADQALSINCWGMTEQYNQAQLEAKVNYEKKIKRHDFNLNALYKMEYYSSMGRNNTDKRIYLTALAGYGYNGRYLIDASFSRVGTSRIQVGNKYNNYPSVSGAWVISNENFLKNMSVIDFLKLRASWGQSGNDAIAYDLQKQYWIDGGGYNYADGIGIQGIKPGTPAIPNLILERVNKYNVGLDVKLFDRLSLSADAYMHQYSNSLIDAGNLYSQVFGNTIPKMNIGKSEYKGIDLSVMWNDKIKDEFSYYAGVNLSLLRSKVIENGEGYKEYDYLSAKGLPVGQMFGYEAIGYFNDQKDIDESPVQQFSEVRPGDIKYRDQNDDKIIDNKDLVAIGHSGSIPEWYGSFQLGFEYKGFGMDLILQGAAGLSRLLNASSVYQPLRNNTNISNWYLQEKIRWTEQTKDIANVPRLSTLDNSNNYQNSTQWLVDGSYLKVRNARIYYNLPEKWISHLKLDKCQIYLSGNNLFSWDHVPYLNCENITLNYPDMFSVYAGVKVSF